MTARPLVLRLLALLLALFQSASPALAAVGDGALAAANGGGPVVAHVEDGQYDGCAPVHAADCALCAYLQVAAEPASCGLPIELAAERAAVATCPAEDACAARPER
ncbi:hypothetical protein, partial [Roseisolibacter sp. H3M3-2]|uniref:hypothetical protein n=1 Tax=Roseisolibacter sp. H3M3-2 TaxID=3031323 RepID=UPI0023DCEB62